MTYPLPPDPAPLPPDPAQFSALLAPPRMYRLAVCLCDTTALSPPLELLAAMIVRLAQGTFSQVAFPEAVLAPGSRWSLPSSPVADPAPCREPTPHAQRSPDANGCGAAESPPDGALPMAAATPHAQRQQPATAMAPAEPTGPVPASVVETPHAQRYRPDIATARTASAPRHTARVAATPHAQRQTPACPPAAPTQPLACDAPPAGAPARQHPMPSGSRGRLKNGAPGGDYLAAPRCGARTRAGRSCQQPAMANGRCRLHGGKSTGARTEAGRERLRGIHTKHGGYGRESLAWFRRVDAFIAETRQMIAPGRRKTAVVAAAPAAADGPSGRNPVRAARSRPKPGDAPNA